MKKPMRCPIWFDCKVENCAHKEVHEKNFGCSGRCPDHKNFDSICYPITEDKMKDKEIAIKVSDLKKAYDEGCEDVKATLKRMYPDVLKVEKIEITDKCLLRLDMDCGFWYLKLLYNGEEVAYTGDDGKIKLMDSQSFSVENNNRYSFKIFKNNELLP